MAKGYILRGQGLGYVTSKVFLHWPSKDDFADVMKQELQLHGFEIKQAGEAGAPLSVEARERWVRVEEIEIVEGKCTEEDAHPAKLNDFTHAVLNADALAKIFEVARPSGQVESAAPLMQITGTGRVTNPGESGYEPDEAKLQGRESIIVTAADVGTLKL